MTPRDAAARAARVAPPARARARAGSQTARLPVRDAGAGGAPPPGGRRGAPGGPATARARPCAEVPPRPPRRPETPRFLVPRRSLPRPLN